LRCINHLAGRSRPEPGRAGSGRNPRSDRAWQSGRLQGLRTGKVCQIDVALTAALAGGAASQRGEAAFTVSHAVSHDDRCAAAADCI